MGENFIGNHIYVGAPIDQESERQFLAFAAQWLHEQKVPFVILANVHIGGRQVDCVLATCHGVAVVEVKSSYLQLRGDINGPWARLHASGDWKPYTNAYQQALAAKNVLRDAMNAIKPVDSFYPDGYVVFTSGLAEGSQVTAGDFKVKVTALDQFLSSLKLQGTSPWSVSDWHAFAEKLALTPISIDDVVASREHRTAVEIVTQYNTAFVAEYGRYANRWLPENSEQQSSLRSAATSGAGCFVTGASGCGKTLMAKWIAVECASAGNPTFFFAAKDFTGSWADALRREISLLADQTSSSLLRATTRVDRPVFLVLDGINELGTHRQNALRGIRTLARRLGAKLIITGQEDKPPEFGGLDTVTVNRPSLELKRRIAQSGGFLLSDTALEILKAAGSGIEAEIVGHVSDELKVDATRLTLLDQYIRMRLGEHARPGSLGLRRLASRLHEQVAFSIAESEFDELMRTHEVRFVECDRMFTAGLLVRRAGRISFFHEMFQNACAAFDLARKAGADPTAYGSRLSTPLLEGMARDVVAAIEDASVCRGLLEAVNSPSLLCAAANGELGPIPASVARALLDEAVETCMAEIQSARLALIKENDAVRVDWIENSRRDWSDVERARLCAIGFRAVSRTGMDIYLDLCAAMDKRLSSERQQLTEAARAEKFPLRSQSFALAYYGFGSQIGFTHVARAGQPGLVGPHRGEEKPEFKLAEMSSGQLHFFLGNWHTFCEQDEERFAEGLIYLLRERFRWEPYHVQLVILHAAGFAGRSSDEQRARLVEAINALEVNPSNWAINSSIVDALKHLGSIEADDETQKQIKDELYSVLGDDEEGIDKNFALSLCSRMFDHPYDSFYGELIFELEELLRRRLYRRALGASDIRRSMNLAWLSGQVASFDDAADATLFWSLANLPDASNPFPQEEWAGFVLAVRFLGRHGSGLPSIVCETSADRCLTDIRTLMYTAESKRPPDVKGAREAWARLHAMPTQLAIGCLSEVHEALTARHWSEDEQTRRPLHLMDIYSADCLKQSWSRLIGQNFGFDK